METVLLNLKKEIKELIFDHNLQIELAKRCEENGLLYGSFFEGSDGTQSSIDQSLESASLRKLLVEEMIRTNMYLNDFNIKLEQRKKKEFQLF